MTELGQLEAHHEDFARRNARIVVVSLETPEEAAKTFKQFPHLIPVGDADAGLIKTADVLHHHAAPDGRDAAAPTTFLIDRAGIVRWLFRPNRYLERITPEDLLAAVEKNAG